MKPLVLSDIKADQFDHFHGCEHVRIVRFHGSF